MTSGFLIILSSCQHIAVNAEDRSCENHSDCNDAQICGPLQNLCADILETDCNTNSNICPSKISTGYYCGETGTLLPCSDSATDCRAGCRTCLEDGKWSECVGAICEEGEAWSCASCDDNCSNSILNAAPSCDTNQDPARCSYEGTCYSGNVDTDEDKGNGCECTVQFSGVERCNGTDDDCDGIIDNNALCGLTLECVGGECVCTDSSCNSGDFCNHETGICEACTNDDNDHCGPSCFTCTGSPQPVCIDGACTCNEEACGEGLYCEAASESCTECANNDPDHCGLECLLCTDTIEPLCVDGACACTEESCPSDHYCNANADCLACTLTDPLHCGPTCLLCSGTTPACAGGTCKCTVGSCDTGHYCNNGACTACGCPSLFPSCHDIGSSSFQCDCTATSCLTQSGVAGSCGDNDSSCTFYDNFEGTSELMSLCPSSDLINSNWAWGSISYPSDWSCNSGTSCWGTNLGGNYSNCEFSCIETPELNLNGVKGSLSFSFKAKY
ncbi:hypothetical protein KAI87_14505, partial [Myxococcota bacterium]|nr:hypothetical protein [Myxococcota bacterium]